MSCRTHGQDPPWRARGPVIAYAVQMALKDQANPQILEIGSGIGYIIRDVKGLIPDGRYTGVDHVNYFKRGILCTPFDFIHADVREWVQETNETFDLTICSWILVHLNLKATDPFWKGLSRLSKHLVTFENEIQQQRNLQAIFESCGLVQTWNETFAFHDNEYELRLFKNGI